MTRDPLASSPGFALDIGANPRPDGSSHFRVWAPRVENLAVRSVADGGRHALTPRDSGFFEGRVPGMSAGTDYLFVLDGDKERPDPASRFQPHGVHGPLRIVDPHAFQWSDRDWHGVPHHDLVIYELHVGTFTREGTFDAVIERLGDLVDLGVNAIELMPVAEFPGTRNWGYDGVHLFAPQSSYGGPDGLKRLVNACHAVGLGCVLDVVYNHLGPEGNYLREFGHYFSDRYRTPWGDALNFDGPHSDPVRAHFIANALHWLTEYHIDALRLDAVHAIYDFGADHLLAALGRRFHAEAARLGRHAWLIAESDLNDVRVIRADSEHGWGMDAQWSDDFHHSLHTLLTGATHGYFGDFGEVNDLAKAVTDGFVYDGRYSGYRRRRHGNSSRGYPGQKLVVYTQNHDQIANASHGRRHSNLLGPTRQKLAATLLLSAPNLPMLFQGQEYGEPAPFHYFTSHGDAELAEAVRGGRRGEFVEFGQPHRFADPQAVATFEQCVLDWSLRATPPHAAILALYRDLLSLRRRLPALGNCRPDLTRVHDSRGAPWLAVERSDPSGSAVLIVANPSQEAQNMRIIDSTGHWELSLWTLDPRYVADGESLSRRIAQLINDSALELLPWEAAIYWRTN